MVKLEDILNLPEVYAKGTPFPCLFLLVNEAFSHLIFKSCSNGSLNDDTLFFLKAPTANCRRLDILPKWYCIASGQLINLDKSNIFFSPNVPSELRIEICDVLNIQPAVNLGKYLGLPTVWGRSKKEALSYIKERITKVIHGSNCKALMYTGKEILIKAIAAAILAYPMTWFKLPSTLCYEIGMIMANF
ncbi:unnamed protein product [Prunus armeniaca]